MCIFLGLRKSGSKVFFFLYFVLPKLMSMEAEAGLLYLYLNLELQKNMKKKVDLGQVQEIL